jgi:hypothetical protein
MTRTFFTSTKFRAPAIAPLLRYACALGASCVVFHVAETLENARSCRRAADDSVVGRRLVNGLAVLDVKVREDAEGAKERYWLVRAVARRARREHRAIFTGCDAARRLGNAVQLGLLRAGEGEEQVTIEGYQSSASRERRISDFSGG